MLIKTRAILLTLLRRHYPNKRLILCLKSQQNNDLLLLFFSLDLLTKGDTPEERESHKRALNLKLINLMITEIPTESKFCVSYSQLKGCYWTIPATST
jgi:hypothetical protein